MIRRVVILVLALLITVPAMGQQYTKKNPLVRVDPNMKALRPVLEHLPLTKVPPAKRRIDPATQALRQKFEASLHRLRSLGNERSKIKIKRVSWSKAVPMTSREVQQTNLLARQHLNQLRFADPPQRAVVQVRVAHPPSAEAPQGSQSVQTGTIVDANGLVITAAHAFREPYTHVWVWPPNQPQAITATVSTKDHVTDIAVVRFTPASPVVAAELSTIEPVQGQPLFMIGYPWGRSVQMAQMTRVKSNGRFRAGVGQGVIRQIHTGGTGTKVIVVDKPCNSGVSGGPLFDQHGRLAAMVWGSYAGIESQAVSLVSY